MNKSLLSLFLLSFSLTNFSYAKTLEVMSYNVENLFDSKHDEGKIDWSFLPKETPGKSEACAKEKSKYRRQECFDSNWTEDKVNMKIAQIVDLLTKERKTTPDFLALIEVENSNVVGALASKLGYEQFEITNSPDNRGVDVALLFKSNSDVKKISRAEHVVPVDYPSRNILEVEFSLEGEPLTIFVNHWPSLANPDSWRIKAAEVLANRTKEILAKNPLMNFLAVGDFNTIDENNPHPFKSVLFKDNLYFDLADSFKSDKSIGDDIKKKMPLGSYYYAPKDQWNMLDHIFYNANLADGKNLEVDIKSFEIYLPPFALTQVKKGLGSDNEKDIRVFMAPKRFEPEAKTREDMGFSDHFAVVTKISYPDKVKTSESKITSPVKNSKKNISPKKKK